METKITVKLTDQQLKALIELLNNSQFIGSSAEFIVELKQALQAGNKDKK